MNASNFVEKAQQLVALEEECILYVQTIVDKKKNMTPEIQKVIDAWTIEGNPEYYIKQILLLKANWPSLYEAISELVKANK